MQFLPQNPGPFASLQEWTKWRDELIAMGPTVIGVDVELAVANTFIAELMAEHEAEHAVAMVA